MLHPRSNFLITAIAVCLSATLGCSSSDGMVENGDSGGAGGSAGGSGGSAGSGGGTTGGVSGSGGSGSGGAGSGGVSASGGSSGTGGSGSGGVGSGGSSAKGGSSGTGGSGTGGSSAKGGSSGGGATGGASATGGSTGTGGSGLGGNGTGGTFPYGGSSGNAATGGQTATGGTTAAGGSTGSPTSSYKPRLINTTDLGADPDDEESLVRQLVSANEFDLEGLIVATSCWKKSQSSTATLDKFVSAYGQVYSNLSKHAEGYPTAEYLKSISVMGQKGYGMADVGNGKDSPGSELIIAAADKVDPRPLWVTCWGGCNTIAQAITKVKNTRSADELDRFLGKLRIYDVLGQDETGAWMTKTFPKLFYIRATGVYGWQPADSWFGPNVQSKGALGAIYPTKKYAWEGDTPAFLHVYPNGLSDPEKVDQGSWGGRFDTTKKSGIRGMSAVTGESQYDTYLMYGNTSEGASAIKRWSAGYNNDFSARMDWSIKSNYADANHHPIAIVNGDTSRQVLEVSADGGSEVSLSAEGSNDPDKHNLVYAWSVYKEASSYTGTVTISGATSATAKVPVPSGAAGKSVHVVLELHDNGSPNLYAYRRVIINMK